MRFITEKLWTIDSLQGAKGPFKWEPSDSSSQGWPHPSLESFHMWANCLDKAHRCVFIKALYIYARKPIFGEGM